MPIDKIDLPDWAGDDWTPTEGMSEDLETMIIINRKKINEIIDEVNS